MLEVIKKSHAPTYSLFVPFTRLWCAERFLQSLQAMDLPRQSMEVIFYNDTNDTDLMGALRTWLQKHAATFNGALLYQSGKVPPNEFDVAYRRKRICDMKEKSKELISASAYVFGLEDDTVAPPDAFVTLLSHMIHDTDIAIASGIEMGRWSQPLIGIWSIEPLNAPMKVETVPYKEQGIQLVDGTGWYCYLTRVTDYKRAHYRYEGECLGPDVVYAWDLRREGRKVLADWSILCKHMLENGRYLVPSANTVVSTWDKVGNDWILENKKLVLNTGEEW